MGLYLQSEADLRPRRTFAKASYVYGLYSKESKK